jgi:hypothetical protein
MPVSPFTLRVVRADDLLVVTFEFFNLVLDSNTSGTPRRLIRRSPAEEEESRIVVHFQPQNISECAFDENLGTPLTNARIDSRIAGPSRLAFIVPKETAFIPFTLESLLDWSGLDPAQPRPDQFQPPELTETAIELPYRLVLAPSSTAGRWIHRPRPFGPGERSELWHTTYSEEALGVAEDSATAPREFSLMAVWTPDLQPDPDAPTFPMTLSAAKRKEIFQQSAQTGLFAERLRLSALGGWLTVRGPSWNHDIAMGRDQRVRTQSRGVLYPFGHEVSLVTTSERRFVHFTAAARAAYVMQKTVLYILDPVRTFPDPEFRAFPFKQVTMSQPEAVIDSVSNPNQPFVPKVGTVPFRFPLTALDQLNPPRVHQFGAALVFVPENSNAAAAAVQALYAPHATIDMASQSIGFAPDPPSLAAGPTDRTVLRTLTMTLGEEITGSSRRFPVMKEASVVLPAAEQLYGAAAKAVPIKLNPNYVLTGAAPDDVFADIIGGLKMPLPAEKAGGVAAPNLEMTAVSALHGAFPDVKSAFASKLPENPTIDDVEKLRRDLVKQFFGGKLLGVIDLAKIVGFSNLPSDLPQISPQTEPSPGMAFTWKPKLSDSLPEPLQKLDGLQHKLELNGIIGADSSMVYGELRNVALTFVNMLKLEFNRLTFRIQSGQSPKFDASLKKLTFTGQLEFVDKLTSLLPLEGFGKSGPPVKTSPEGVSAGLSLAIPTIPLGPLILQNLALSAELNLFFFGKPASVTFALSSKKDPFIVTYTVFGGGGYFEFTIDTNRDVSLVASLGFGGAAAIDLVIAKGVIQVMVGIEFTLKNKEVELGGFVRIYGYVEILKLVSISVEFYMTLSYKAPYAIGSAALIVMVRVLGFSKSFKLSVERRFSTSDNDVPALARGAPEPTITRAQWEQYCLAFTTA